MLKNISADLNLSFNFKVDGFCFMLFATAETMKPGRLISDNITLIQHVLEVSGSLAVDTGLISLDQEKAFDQAEH